MSPTSPSPSKEIRTALVGCGRIADVHVRAYQHEPRARLIALCDRDPSVLAARSKEWGVEKTYTDYPQLLQDPSIDAVEICTPTALHFEMVQAAARAGKHISVQKPVTLELEQARRLQQECAQRGVVLKVCENYVFHPAIVRAREMIQDGTLGQILSLQCRVVGGSGGWPIPSEAWKWRLKDAQVAGGTQTFDHGHHIFSTAWYLLGRFEKIHGWIHSVDGILDAPASFHWTYEDHIAQGSAVFTVSTDMPIDAEYYGNDEWFEITGTRSILWINNCTAHIRKDLPAMTLYQDREIHEIDDLSTNWQEGFTGALQNFIDAITGQAPAHLDAEEGIEILACALAAQRSHHMKRPVYLEEMRKHTGEWHHQRRRLQGFVSRLKLPTWLQRWQRTQADVTQCAAYTEGLVDRFRPEVVRGWDACIWLDISGPHGGQWTIRIHHDTVDIQRGHHGEPGLTLRSQDTTWTAILDGKKGVEMAFLQGKIQTEGETAWALSLKKAFGL